MFVVRGVPYEYIRTDTDRQFTTYVHPWQQQLYISHRGQVRIIVNVVMFSSARETEEDRHGCVKKLRGNGERSCFHTLLCDPRPFFFS